jgi:hypothetical protein
LRDKENHFENDHQEWCDGAKDAYTISYLENDKECEAPHGYGPAGVETLSSETLKVYYDWAVEKKDAFQYDKLQVSYKKDTEGKTALERKDEFDLAEEAF